MTTPSQLALTPQVLPRPLESAIGLGRMMVSMDAPKLDRQQAAAVLRDLVVRVRNGELDGRRAIPFLLGAAAALEAEGPIVVDDELEPGDPPASSSR